MTAPASASIAGPSVPRIAVIAVHGVADRKPDAADAAIASLLVEHTIGAHSRSAPAGSTCRSTP